MKLLPMFLALTLMPVGMPLVAESRVSTASCATSAAKVASVPKLTLPQDAKVTSNNITFDIDVGSDGRARGLEMVQSSGDPAVDLTVRQTLQAASYEPPQTGCVAYSGGLRFGYSLASAAAAAPQPSPMRSPPTSACTPFIVTFLTPLVRDRKRTGTAVVAVEVDASGARTAMPALRKSTGSAVLDQEALRLAASGHFSFLRDGPCAPQAFTYQLELTFQ